MRTQWTSLALPVAIAGVLFAYPTLSTGQSPAKADALIREAQRALQSEDYAAAQRYFEAASAADRSSSQASCGLGQVYLALRQYEPAVEALQRCKAQILAELRRLQAERARSWGQIDNEIRELNDAIQAIQSGHVKSAGPDRVLRLEERIRELEQMKSRGGVEVVAPPQVSFALGTALLQTGRLAEAEPEFLEVIESHVDPGDAHNNLAAVYLAQGRWDDAGEQIRLAEEAGIRVSPQMKRDLEFRNSPNIGMAAPVPRAPTPGSENELVSIRHQGRTCALGGTFVRIEATVRPPWSIYDPKIRFRTGASGGWYAAIMLPAGDDVYAAILPKPRSAKSFEYYIEVSTFDGQEARTDDFRVKISTKRTDCAEASSDPEEVGSVLIIDRPPDVADAPPVPDGFSIRGTTADAGVLELGPNKSLIAGGVVLAGSIVGAAALGRSDGDYSGPHPFEDGPGIELVASDPPQGGTLSLSSGSISLQLRVFTPQAIPGAKIAAELATAFGSACIRLTGIHDLPGGRDELVVISGPTLPASNACDSRVPLSQLRVSVTGSSGLGGFRTGIPPLGHLSVLFNLEE